MATDIKNSSLATNLVSYWELEETSGTRVDSHGSNNLDDNNTVLQGTGKQGNAADFESSNSEYLSISHASQTGLTLSSGNFTVAAWVKPETISLGYSAEILGKSGGVSTGWYFQQLTSGVVRFVNDGATPVTTGASSVSVGTWSHLVVTYDGTNLRFYFNAVLRGGPTAASNPTSDSAEFRISSTVINSTRYYDGIVDEVGIWSRALSAAEVSDLYNSGAGLPYDAGGGGSTFVPKAIII